MAYIKSRQEYEEMYKRSVEDPNGGQLASGRQHAAASALASARAVHAHAAATPGPPCWPPSRIHLPASAGFWRDIAVRDFHWRVDPDQEHFSSNFDLRKVRRVDFLRFPPFSGCDAVASSKNKLTCVAGGTGSADSAGACAWAPAAAQPCVAGAAGRRHPFAGALGGPARHHYSSLTVHSQQCKLL